MLKNDNSHAENKFNKKEMHLCSARRPQDLGGRPKSLYWLHLTYAPPPQGFDFTLHTASKTSKQSRHRLANEFVQGAVKKHQECTTSPHLILCSTLIPLRMKKTLFCLLYCTNLPMKKHLIVCYIGLICLEKFN